MTRGERGRVDRITPNDEDKRQEVLPSDTYTATKAIHYVRTAFA
ncbi:MAG: hypothetical protein ACKVOR_02505 [Flavobacteriales bacterium]